MHILLKNFEIQTDHLISTRRPDLVIINRKKRTIRIMDFTVPADHSVKFKEIEKRDKYLDLARELKKTMEHENDGDTYCNWCTCYSYQKIDKGTGVLGNKRTSGDHPDCSIIKIDQNTKKSPGDLRRLVVTQTPVEDHLTLVRKTFKGVK